MMLKINDHVRFHYLNVKASANDSGSVISDRGR
jgi:hypothetical protein